MKFSDLRHYISQKNKTNFLSVVSWLGHICSFRYFRDLSQNWSKKIYKFKIIDSMVDCANIGCHAHSVSQCN